ncbi:hypothetical protein B7463_g11900, partial [Scytalidium lignicola]
MNKQTIVVALDNWLNVNGNEAYDQRGIEQWNTDNNVLVNEDISKITFRKVVITLRSSQQISQLDVRMTRELLARVIFLYAGSLTRTSVGALLPRGIRIRPGESSGLAMATELTQTAHNGVQVNDQDFTNDHINNTQARLVFWFRRLNRNAIRWNVRFVRDVLHLDYLVEAADSGRFSVEDRDEARNILHMIRLRLMYAAEVVFSEIVMDGIVMDPGFNANRLASAAARWAQMFTRAYEFIRHHVGRVINRDDGVNLDQDPGRNPADAPATIHDLEAIHVDVVAIRQELTEIRKILAPETRSSDDVNPASAQSTSPDTTTTSTTTSLPSSSTTPSHEANQGTRPAQSSSRTTTFTGPWRPPGSVTREPSPPKNRSGFNGTSTNCKNNKRE